ncbi:nematocyst expressed protein 3-like [Oenanthe melanoleuca]|uniref:nematocyst expressed protein 3-like n=1 Tax=Oenanthe melanoleuca TaxID=2939378 RepID=UPI0024C11A66|nr:nematocyst expressed protein 3-like [Oenanthe melanoleuca]
MLGLPRPAVRAVGRKRSLKPPLLPRRRLPAPGGGGGGRDGPLGEVARIDGRGRAQRRSLRAARLGRRFLPQPLARARLARVTRAAANDSRGAAGGGSGTSTGPPGATAGPRPGAAGAAPAPARREPLPALAPGLRERHRHRPAGSHCRPWPRGCGSGTDTGPPGATAGPRPGARSAPLPAARPCRAGPPRSRLSRESLPLLAPVITAMERGEDVTSRAPGSAPRDRSAPHRLP